MQNTDRPIDLAALLGDTTREEFDIVIRDRSRLHVPQALTRDETRRLFPLSRFDALANGAALSYPDIEVVEGGRPGPPQMDADKRPLPGALATRLAAGATLRMRHIDLLDQEVNAVNIALGDDLDATMQVNAFLTPANSAGFDPHYDQRDIWVVQTHGSKTWRIYEQGKGPGDMELPLSGEGYNPRTMTVGPMIDEITLREGDALYLPRGTGHAPICTDEPSLHLTFSLIIETVGDLIVEYVRKLHRSRLALRQRVGHAELADIDALMARVAAEGVLQDMDAGLLAQVAGDRMRTFTSRAIPTSVGSIAAALDKAEPADTYRHVPETVWRASTGPKGETLHIGRSSYAMGAPEMAMVRAIADAGTVRRDALKDAHPGVDVDMILKELHAKDVIRPVR